MTEQRPEYPHGSPEERSVFSFIYHRSGTMRLRPLMRHMRMKPATFVDAINDLVARGWLTCVWRKSAGTPGEESRPITDVARLTTTRWGRRRYRETWPTI
jgi:hypothetical protein